MIPEERIYRKYDEKAPRESTEKGKGSGKDAATVERWAPKRVKRYIERD
jgi:hypothetical protein